jgi:hypothetical protein
MNAEGIELTDWYPCHSTRRGNSTHHDVGDDVGDAKGKRWLVMLLTVSSPGPEFAIGGRGQFNARDKTQSGGRSKPPECWCSGDGVIGYGQVTGEFDVVGTAAHRKAVT